MKKIISMLLALAMICALAIPACAADSKAGSGSTTNVSLKYQSGINPEDEDPNTNVPERDDPYEEPTDPEPGDPSPLTGTYCIVIPANICMDQFAKIKDGAVYLNGEGTVKFIQNKDGSGLTNDAIVNLSVASANGYKIMNGDDELCSYTLGFGQLGSGITLTNNAIDTDAGDATMIAKVGTKAFATSATMVVNLNTTSSNIYGDVSVKTGDILTWTYGVDGAASPAAFMMYAE